MAKNAKDDRCVEDEFFMRRALELAQETTALASPNPQVGCVIVRTDANDEVIGEGAHLYDHYDHAEIAALKQIEAKGLSAFGATAYVTLEPCSHHGRTGPCADALIAAGVARCVVATTDPNPLVAGRGIEKLRHAGVSVAIGVLQQEARALNDAFAHFIQTGRPLVTLKTALSADGKLAPVDSSRNSREPFWLTGPAAREQVQQLRHASDAILTGIGTVLADDPQLTDRTGEARRRPLLRVVLDTHLRIPVESNLVRSTQRDLLIVAGTAAAPERVMQLTDAGVEVVQLPANADGIELERVLALLGKRKITSVLLEAGSHLNAAFLRSDLVDRVVLFRAPTLLGSDAIPFAKGIDPAIVERALVRPLLTEVGPDTCITGYLHDPWN